MTLKIGTDRGGTYFFYDIIDYDCCCSCQYFSDNFQEERFECLNLKRTNDNCNCKKEIHI